MTEEPFVQGKQPGAYMVREISEQPRLIEELLQSGAAGVREVAEIVRRRQPRFAMLAARGTSDNAATYGKYLIETRLGMPAALASPSTFTLFRARPDLREVLFLAVSQSGGSPDLIESTRMARALGATTIAITNSPGSPLADESEFHIDIRAGQELAVAATKSYTAELMTLWMWVQAYRGESFTEAEILPEIASLYVARRGELADVASDFSGANHLVVTARGFSYPTAMEAALKIMETSYIPALAFSGADLEHGPIAMLGPSSHVVAVAPSGVGADSLAPLLGRLDELGVILLALGDLSLRRSAEHFFSLTRAGDSLSPIVDVIPLQWLALELALLKGFDPDHPRGLSKLTQTM